MDNFGPFPASHGSLYAPFESSVTLKPEFPSNGANNLAGSNGLNSIIRPTFWPRPILRPTGNSAFCFHKDGERHNYLSSVLHRNNEKQLQSFCSSKIRQPYFNKAVTGKRKSNCEESNFSPIRKQYITEEKMAACMQMLSLDSDNNVPVAMGSVKQQNDDSDFEDDCDLEEEEKLEKRIPIFELHSDFKERLKQNAQLLPDSILDNLRSSSPCLAIVPYNPPQEFVRNIVRERISDIKENKDVDLPCEVPVEPMKMEDNEFFELDWDTDSDNDLVLD